MFLHLEDDNTHMHVASVTIFEGAVDYQEALDEVNRRLHLVPRFRQKLAFVPLQLERPVWVDDPHFNVEYHVRHTALPEPGTEESKKAGDLGDLLASEPKKKTSLDDLLGSE